MYDGSGGAETGTEDIGEQVENGAGFVTPPAAALVQPGKPDDGGNGGGKGQHEGDR